jgi:hypothetical protein
MDILTSQNENKIISQSFLKMEMNIFPPQINGIRKWEKTIYVSNEKKNIYVLSIRRNMFRIVNNCTYMYIVTSKYVIEM